MSAADAPVLVYSPDLLMRQQLVAGIEANGYPATGAATSARYEAALDTHRFRAIVLELDGIGIDAESELHRLAQAPATQAVPVVGFCAHTRVELIAAARSAGARVASRGEIVRRLPQILHEVLSRS